MRTPHQILAFPFKKNKEGKYIYAIFNRSGSKEQWQGIAGGVEDSDESYLMACKREASEEASFSFDAPVYELKSTSTIPVINVIGDFIFGDDVYLVEEHCFGIDATDEKINISNEHKKYEWLTYEEADKKLKWDSNKNALWELNLKLTNSKLY